jgi:hypothetical protein
MKSVAAFGSIGDICPAMKCAIVMRLTFTLSLTACVSISEPPVIDTDVNQWTHYAFSEGTATVAIKVPPHLRASNSSLPELTYKRAQRLLLDAQYDFGTGASSYTSASEFEIKVDLVKLGAPLNNTSVTADELDGALVSAFGHPIKGTESPKPIEQSTRGRKWIYYDNTTDVTYSQTRETYATVINATTALLITAWYGPDIRKSPPWFDSRRRVLRDVRDNTSITGVDVTDRQ